jgi:hypothetical protein
MAYDNTYVAIATQTAGSPVASVTFSSIPQTYTDLMLVVAGANSGANFYMRPNADTNNRYSTTYLQGEGTVAQTGRFDTSALGGNGMLPARGAGFSPTNTNITTCTIQILNYTNTNTFKTVLSRWGQSTTAVGASVNLYQSTGAITQLECFPFASNWATGTTFSLYGIAATGSNPAAKATGGTITYSADGYTYHTFTSSGTFTPSVALTCDYLVVAGGASGWLGGGGAGGLRSTVSATGGGGSVESSLSLSSGTNYTVTIGAGGAPQGIAGSNSVFATITSTGGGAGSSGGNTGGTGGSGGGGGYGLAGGSGTTGQGFAGGTGSTSGGNATGGGGGAGSVGTNSATGYGGNGGNGIANSITGTPITLAGGGGAYGSVNAGVGGTGGGGNGSPGGTGGSGTVNTGSGGGGGGSVGGAGGSGIVIVRYASA